MDILNNIVAIILTSSVVSAAVSFVLKVGFEERLKHHFQLELEKLRHSYEIELEKLKSELTISADIAQELTERRLAVYPKIVELVYRTRNMTREISNATNINQVLMDELTARTQELEDSLYAYRIDLERESIFHSIHTYKNTLKIFNKMVDDLSYYRKRREQEHAEEALTRLRNKYTEIEKQHKSIIEELSSRDSNVIADGEEDSIKTKKAA